MSRSIFLRQKQGGRGSIRFGDDPDLFRTCDRIAAHQPKTMFEAQFVLSPVVRAEIAPIAAKMPGQEFDRATLGLLEQSERAWSRDDLTGREKRNDR